MGSTCRCRSRIPRSWDAALIDEAEALLVGASRLAGSGGYQLEAAVQSAHVIRRHTGRPDWIAIEQLVRRAPRAHGIARRRDQSRRRRSQKRAALLAALAALDELKDDVRLSEYQPYWAARAGVLAQLGELDAADLAYERAIGLEREPAVRAFFSSDARRSCSRVRLKPRTAESG